MKIPKGDSPLVCRVLDHGNLSPVSYSDVFFM